MGLVRWARRESLWLYPFGTSCCADALLTALGPGSDPGPGQGFLSVDTPEHGDILVVAGRLSRRAVPILEDAYERMSTPKLVVAFGSCASTGGLFDTYAVVQGLSSILPVDVCVPGCPPRPDDLFRALGQLRRDTLHASSH